MDEFKMLYQYNYRFEITNVSKSVTWYKQDEKRSPENWEGYNFIADV